MSAVEVSTSESAPSLASGEAVAAESPSWQDQDGVLRDMWLQNNTPQAIAEALGRSVPAIMTRAARLGLPRRTAPGRKPGRRTLNETEAPKTPRTQAAVQTRPTAQEQPALQRVARICLMCLTKFESAGRHNRICTTCKDTSEYKTAFSLPDITIPDA